MQLGKAGLCHLRRSFSTPRQGREKKAGWHRAVERPGTCRHRPHLHVQNVFRMKELTGVPLLQLASSPRFELESCSEDVNSWRDSSL